MELENLEQQKEKLLSTIRESQNQLKQLRIKIKQKQIEIDQTQDLPAKKKLLKKFLKQTQAELDAYVELIENNNISPTIANCFDEGTKTEGEWIYQEGELVGFDFEQDYWLMYKNKYIDCGSYQDMMDQSWSLKNDEQTLVKEITPKSVLLKRKEWLLTQIKQLEN